MAGLRLNLGCVAKRLAGYVNVDKFGDPDLHFNLETFPYPWSDNSVAEVAKSDYFITCDKRLINRCSELTMRVINPVDFILEISSDDPS